MTRILNKKIIINDFVNKRLIGTSSRGRLENLIKIDQVDKFDLSGSISSFLRIQLNNRIEDVQDSFFFSLKEDMKLTDAYLQTTERNMKLLEWEMALIQRQSNFNEFIKTIAEEYFQKELGFSKFKIT